MLRPDASTQTETPQGHTSHGTHQESAVSHLCRMLLQGIGCNVG